MKTVDFVRGKEWAILGDYGFVRTDNRHIDCPLCGSKKKFRINEYKGEPSYICTCGSGNMWTLLCEYLSVDFASIAKQIDEKYGNTGDYEAPKPKPRVETSLYPIQDSEVKKYLNGRGITQLPLRSVFFTRNIYHKETSGHYNCMHSVASDPFLSDAKIHLTYIENGVKISGIPAKKMYNVNESRNIAVRMFDVDSCLGIGEGIESSLSAAQMYNLPVWSTLSSAIMKSFRAPIGVKTLFIFSDTETHGAGLAAAFHCANMNLLCKNEVNKVVVKWPKMGDFNDMLVNPGNQIFEWTFTR